MQPRVQTKSIGDLFEMLQNQLRNDKTDSKKILEKVSFVERKRTQRAFVCNSGGRSLIRLNQTIPVKEQTAHRPLYSRVFVELDRSVRLDAILNVTAWGRLFEDWLALTGG